MKDLRPIIRGPSKRGMKQFAENLPLPGIASSADQRVLIKVTGALLLCSGRHLWLAWPASDES
jgi:hypothetical protein